MEYSDARAKKDAYNRMRRVERLRKAYRGIKLSVDKVLDFARTIAPLRVHMPNNRSFYTKTMFLTDSNRAIRQLFEMDLGQL